jgi:membrane associated rhomboid family serine protease
MNPITRLYRRSRAFRVVLYVLFVPLTLLVFVISDDMWRKYTQVGNLTALAAFIVFALWAWWYGEDRDRRREGVSVQGNRASSADGDGR